MTTHQPPPVAHHALPGYPAGGTPEQQKRYGFNPAAADPNYISDREHSDREVRTDALDSAIQLLKAVGDTAVSGITERDVLLVADTFAHYIASGVVPPSPRPIPGALHLPLKLDDAPDAAA
jgi:hypothetical protein